MEQGSEPVSLLLVRGVDEPPSALEGCLRAAGIDVGIAVDLESARAAVQQGEAAGVILTASTLAVAPPRADEEPPTHHPPLDVLVVADDTTHQALVVRILEWAGHEARVAESGREALERVAAHPADLVLMDLEAPELDGRQTAALIRLRERGSGRRTPILAIVDPNRWPERERCLEAGIDACLAKPLQGRELVRAIEQLRPAH